MAKRQINMKWDLFISHASEDKKSFVKEFANRISSVGVNVWYDEFTIKAGDSISKTLDQGLINSKYGVIVISKPFINKGWTDYELRAFLNREIGYKKVILPIWHNISKEEVQNFSPFLADKFALNTQTSTLEEIVYKIIEVVRPDIFENLQRHLLFEELLKKGEKKISKPTDVFHSIVFHDKLPKEITNRIELMHGILGKVSGIPLDKTIENFKRDMHPEKELKIWEGMALAYQKIICNYKIENEEIQGEVFSILLGYTMGVVPKETRFAYNSALDTILEYFKQYYPK